MAAAIGLDLSMDDRLKAGHGEGMIPAAAV
jgi:hypothetical protein